MTQGGTLSAKVQGTYSMRFALKDKENYHWEDGTTEDKILTWTIGKAHYKLGMVKVSASQFRVEVMNPTGLTSLSKQWDLHVTVSPSALFTAVLDTISNNGPGQWQGTVKIRKKQSATQKGMLRITLTYTGTDSNIDSTPIAVTQGIIL